jgi:uncharacterized membrane protein YkvA (DUF1232 family)
MADEKRRIPLRPRAAAPRDDFDDEFEDEEELVGPRRRGAASGPRRGSAPPARGAGPARGRTPARGADREWIRSLVRDIPSMLKLLWGLARDPRVSKADKAIVVAAIAYAVLPLDLIPDWIPALGEIEDVLLLALALSRLLNHAGDDVLLDHWDGDEDTLEALLDALDAATQYLPAPVRGLLGGRR